LIYLLHTALHKGDLQAGLLVHKILICYNAFFERKVACLAGAPRSEVLPAPPGAARNRWHTWRSVTAAAPASMSHCREFTWIFVCAIFLALFVAYGGDSGFVWLHLSWRRG
jgi:hypothetical protein